MEATKVMKTIVAALGISLVFLPAAAAAQDFQMPKTKYRMETCMQQAFKKQAGKVIRVELKMENDVPVYEFDIETEDGKAWDIECDALTARIVEIEEEVQATDPRFSSLAQVREDEARRTALTKHPGEITAVEYELEPDGSASYEFAIRQEDGTYFKVEVDVRSGEIVEAHPRLYEIGTE
jgi:uncharacterized membrane protein YkoI